METTIKTYNCPLCHKDRRVLVILGDEEEGYALCLDCRIFFTDWRNINQRNDIKKGMRNNYYGTCGTTDDSNPGLEHRAKAYLPTIKSLLNGKPEIKILDIGMAHPAVLNEAQKIGWQTCGIDINKHADDSKLPHRIIYADFEELEINEKFDVIWASHIFEHFKNPITMLKKVYSLLNDNGIVFIAMPDLYYFNIDDPKRWGHWNTREHHTLWDLVTWAKRMAEQGFDIKQMCHNPEKSFCSWHDFHIIAQKGKREQ